MKKIGHFSGTICHKLLTRFSSNLVCEVVFMEGITMQINFGKIRPVVIEIQGVVNSDLVVLVNSTLVCSMAFLTAETWPCVLMKYCLLCYCTVGGHGRFCMWMSVHVCSLIELRMSQLIWLFLEVLVWVTAVHICQLFLSLFLYAYIAR